MKKIEINKKLVNHIMISGNKKTSEKILIKSIKNLQKESLKQSKKLLQLAVLNAAPIFKLHKISNKKRNKRNKKVREIPAFISNTFTRESLSIKFILANAIKKKLSTFHLKLKQEILLAAQQKSAGVEMKNELQQQVALKKHFFTYYRWR